MCTYARLCEILPVCRIYSANTAFGCDWAIAVTFFAPKHAELSAFNTMARVPVPPSGSGRGGEHDSCAFILPLGPLRTRVCTSVLTPGTHCVRKRHRVCGTAAGTLSPLARERHSVAPRTDYPRPRYPSNKRRLDSHPARDMTDRAEQRPR